MLIFEISFYVIERKVKSFLVGVIIEYMFKLRSCLRIILNVVFVKLDGCLKNEKV